MAGLLDFLGGIGGSIAAKQIQDDSFTSQQQNLQHIYDQIRTIPIPEEQKLQILLSLPEVAGQLSPEQLSAIKLQQTALSDIGPDQTREAQLGALQQLQGLSKTGLTPADLAAMRQLQQQTEAQQQSNDAGLIQQMAQRGKGGGGSELALRALNAQQATNRLSNNADQVAQNAQARALQALSSVGNLSGTMRGQDYQEAQNKANAIDAINRYNAMNQQGAAQQNVQANNQAQGFNLQNAQNVANARTGIQNQQQMYNAQIPQLLFQDQLSKAGAMQDPAVNLAKIEANRGKANAGYALGLGQAAGGLGQSLFNTFMNQGGEVPKTTEDAQGSYYSGYAKGGMIPCYDEGGMVKHPAGIQADPNPMATLPGATQGADTQQSNGNSNMQSDIMKALQAGGLSRITQQEAQAVPAAAAPSIGGDLSKILDKIKMMSMIQGAPTQLQANNVQGAKMAYKGGQVPCYDEGGVVQDPDPMAHAPKTEKDSSSDMLSQLAPLAMMMFAKQGGRVPGVPKVKGNSIQNDIVPVMASPGEIFIPNSHSSNLEKSKQFLDHVFKMNKVK